MCWSASADLVAGVVVVGIGAVGLGLARDRRDVPLAALPVLLGAHQLIESRVYAESAGPGATVRGVAVTTWTVIAFVVLPVFVPLVLLLAERERRAVQYAAAAIGVVVGIVTAVDVSGGVHAVEHEHVMDYAVGVPWLPAVLAGYLVATCVPFLTSYERSLRELGVALGVGAVVATLISAYAFASIWCAFAAVVSLLVVRRTVHAARHLPERVL